MDRKNNHHNTGFDSRCFWPQLIPVPWPPVPGVGWPTQFPVPSTSGSFIDPSSHIFASPSSTRQQQHANMGQDNGGNSGSPFATTTAGGWGLPAESPPCGSTRSVPAEAAEAPFGAVVSGPQSAGPEVHRLPTTRALQQLARQLDDVIGFCQGCLDQHTGDVEKVAPYMDVACRNTLWRRLLEARFGEDDLHQHLFTNLRADIEYLVQRTMKAAAADVNGCGAETDAEERARREDVAQEVVILRMRAVEVVKLAQEAMEDSAVCQRMIKKMQTMLRQCTKLLGEDKQNGGGQET